MKSKNFKRVAILFFSLALISMSLTSCHRYGCPNKITDSDTTEQVENC